MSKGKYIALSVLLIMLMVASTSGIAFAFMSFTQEQTTPNVVSSTCFGLTFNDQASTPINLTKAYPMSFTSSKSLSPYKFTVSNTCETNSNYVIILNVSSTSDPTLLTFIDYSLNNDKASKLSNTNVPATYTAPMGYSKSYVIGTGSLEGKTTTTAYDLRLWIDEAATLAIKGKTFEARLAVYNEAT